jgi:AcrR family transcriptional regulator
MPMSPRPYTLGKRQAAAAETRAQILAAARRQLAGGDVAAFSVEAVARAADVARMTVYYQFGSRAGLLEALFDALAEHGAIARRLPAAFRQPDPLAALDGFVAAFGHFWTADRLLIRRLNALAVLDPEIAAGNEARNERRRTGARVILGRLAERYGRPAPADLDQAVDALFTLTSFATFDDLAGPTRSPNDVTPIVQRLVRAALGLPPLPDGSPDQTVASP